MLIEYIPTYKYFSNFVDINNVNQILDFGSNCGNLLKSTEFLQTRYTGVDVDLESIDEGKRLFPDANWIWYNRYNPVYNSTGIQTYPVLPVEYDLIVSYSVFSHISVNDAFDLLAFLYSKLTDKGRILFSYCNVDNEDCVKWFRNRRIECDIIPKQDYVYLVDNKVLNIVPKQCNHFVTFYRTEWLLEKLKEFNPISHPAPQGWYQDCMELKK